MQGNCECCSTAVHGNTHGICEKHYKYGGNSSDITHHYVPMPSSPGRVCSHAQAEYAPAPSQDMVLRQEVTTERRHQPEPEATGKKLE